MNLRILFSALCLLAACSQPIQMDLGDNSGKAVIYGLIEADSVAEVVITETQSYYGWLEDDNSLKFLEKLEPKLRWEGGEEILKGSWGWKAEDYGYGYIDSAWIFRYRGNTLIEAGKSYQLSFLHEGEMVSGAATIPTPAMLEQVEYARKTYVYPDGGSWTSNFLEGSFTDVSGADHSYQMRYIYWEWQYDYDYDPNTNDYVKTDSQYVRVSLESGVLPQSRDGGSMRIETPFYGGSSYPWDNFSDTTLIDIKVVLETQEAAIGTYINSAFAQRGASQDPFAEPVLLNGNIENGIGIFAGFTVSDTLETTIKVSWR